MQEKEEEDLWRVANVGEYERECELEGIGMLCYVMLYYVFCEKTFFLWYSYYGMIIYIYIIRRLTLRLLS